MAELVTLIPTISNGPLDPLCWLPFSQKPSLLYLGIDQYSWPQNDHGELIPVGEISFLLERSSRAKNLLVNPPPFCGFLG